MKRDDFWKIRELALAEECVCVRSRERRVGTVSYGHTDTPAPDVDSGAVSVSWLLLATDETVTGMPAIHIRVDVAKSVVNAHVVAQFTVLRVCERGR